MTEKMPCLKCGAHSGDDWEQCNGSCPMIMSPHYTPAPEGEAWRHVSQEEVAQAAKFASSNLAALRPTDTGANHD